MVLGVPILKHFRVNTSGSVLHLLSQNTVLSFSFGAIQLSFSHKLTKYTTFTVLIKIQWKYDVPSEHLMPKRRRTNVDATLLRRIDVNTTSFSRHVPAGLYLVF